MQNVNEEKNLSTESGLVSASRSGQASPTCADCYEMGVIRNSESPRLVDLCALHRVTPEVIEKAKSLKTWLVPSLSRLPVSSEIDEFVKAIALLESRERERLEDEIFQDATDPTWAPETSEPDTRGASVLSHKLIVRGHYHVNTLGHIAERLCNCPNPTRYVCASCVDTRAYNNEQALTEERRREAAREIADNIAWLEDKAAHQSIIGDIETMIEDHLSPRVE